MIEYLLLFGLSLKCTFATLIHVADPYNNSSTKNYVYERACHYYATEFSTSRYESRLVSSKVFDSLYLKCLRAIWPNCELLKVTGGAVTLQKYETFGKGEVIIRDIDCEPIKYAHKEGFCTENLLGPVHGNFIFWDPRKPATDLVTFYSIKFATIKTLHLMHMVELAKTIKKFTGVGAEPPDQLYLIQISPNGKDYLGATFENFKGIVKQSLMEVISEIPPLTPIQSSIFDDLLRLLHKRLPGSAIFLHFRLKHSPSERVHLLYPLGTAINHLFPVALRFEPSKMAPISYSWDINRTSFIAAIFDEMGNLLNEPTKDIDSYLVVSFSSIKLR